SDRKRIRLACTGAALPRCYSSMGPGRFRNRRPPGAMLVVRSRRGARAGRGASFERREGVMSATVVAVSLTLAMNSFGLGGAPVPARFQDLSFRYLVPPGPGNGWGFLNGSPDGYGWVSYGVYLPLGADRTAEYFFPRYLAVPAAQMFPETYYD